MLKTLAPRCASRARSYRASLVMLALGAMLVACGGGGSDSSQAPAAPAGTGLVPAAPALGGTLYEKPSKVRPLGPGVKWIYHRSDRQRGYVGDAIVRQTISSTPGIDVVETDSIDSAHPSMLTLDLLEGSIRIATTVALTETLSVPVAGFELRAPVRQNDQYVLLDRHIADTGIDADGDNKADGLDVALYRRVIGDEDLMLPNRSAPLRALRVDTVLVTRFTLSSGAASVPVSATSSTWYAPDLGVVRSLVPDPDPSRSPLVEEQLIGIDAVVGAWGVVTSAPQKALDGQTNLRKPSAALALPDGAMIVAGEEVYQVGMTGGATWMYRAPETSLALFRLASGVVGVAGSWPQLRLYLLPPFGHAPSPTPIIVPLANSVPNAVTTSLAAKAAAPGGDRVWLAWNRSVSGLNGVSQEAIVVRAVAADGSFASPEVVFPVQAAPSRIQLMPRVGSVAVSWLAWDVTLGSDLLHVAKVDDAGTTAWHSQAPLPQGPGSVSTQVNALPDGDGLWLTWKGPSASDAGLLPHAARLDAQGNWLGITPDRLVDSVLTGVPEPLLQAWPWQASAASGSLMLTGAGYGKAYPADQQDGWWIDYAREDVGAGGPSPAFAAAQSARIVGMRELSLPPIAFGPGVLLLTSDGTDFRPTFVYRR